MHLPSRCLTFTHQINNIDLDFTLAKYLGTSCCWSCTKLTVKYKFGSILINQTLNCSIHRSKVVSTDQNSDKKINRCTNHNRDQKIFSLISKYNKLIHRSVIRLKTNWLLGPQCKLIQTGNPKYSRHEKLRAKLVDISPELWKSIHHIYKSRILVLS